MAPCGKHVKMKGLLTPGTYGTLYPPPTRTKLPYTFVTCNSAIIGQADSRVLNSTRPHQSIINPTPLYMEVI